MDIREELRKHHGQTADITAIECSPATIDRFGSISMTWTVTLSDGTTRTISGGNEPDEPGKITLEDKRSLTAGMIARVYSDIARGVK